LPLVTALCERLGVRYPIVQAGMGWVATPELVAAVANAGGFGFLAAATLAPSDVEREIERIEARTDRPFGVSFRMDGPGAAEIVDVLARRHVRAAGYNRAPDPALIERLRQAGVLCMPTCGALEHVRKAEGLGADLVIVQGSEGGGHTGPVPTALLVAQSVDAVRIPVIAAGGFHDGRGLVAALALGAVGIAMGTRFLLTRESPVPAATAERYLRARPQDITVTQQIDGLPQRVIRNELLARLERQGPLAGLLGALRNALRYQRESGARSSELLRAALRLRRNARLTRSQVLRAANAPALARLALREGDPVRGYLPSGSVAGLIDDRPGCGELIERIVVEAERALAALAPHAAGGRAS
jgi:NAD(P)H-dependent flavin oxidoreductase YrpB (nitropropane dioxygenase family)